MLGTYLGHEHLPWVGFALMALGIAIAYSVTIQNRAGMQEVSELSTGAIILPASKRTSPTGFPTR